MDSKQIGLEKGQLSNLKNNEFFNSVFRRLVINENELNISEQEYLLSCAILFFRYYDSDKRFRSYFKIGYYIILKYSILYDDYKPLYDISLQIGFYPISDFLVRNKAVELDFVDDVVLNRSIRKHYTSYEKYIETLEQNFSSKSIIGSKDANIAYIAPTSYGKSSIVREVIIKSQYPRIGIIVPTKSLLIQTYNDIKKLGLNYKLILHDEMYDNNSSFIAILTQERAIRLINKCNTCFDVLFIDEAHNILNRNSRSVLLSRLIQLNRSKANESKIIYLSPLINDSDSLKVTKSNQKDIYTRRITHDLKVFDIYLFDKGRSYLYDKFTAQYHDINKTTDFLNYIIENAQSKNLVYHNRPKKIEQLGIELSLRIPEIEVSLEIRKVVKTLKDEVHQSFYLVPLLNKGVVYIHGKIPNLIKEYLEHSFKTIPDLKFIVANKVILEGINLPIDSLFVTSTYNLHGKDLTNLVGRVNRLNYVFKKNNLRALISKVHFLNNEQYQGTGDIKNKIVLLRDHSFDDAVGNPLLDSYDIEKLKLNEKDKAKRETENTLILDATEVLLSDGVLDDDKGKIRRYLVESSIDDFYHDINKAVDIIFANIKNFQTQTEYQIVDIIRKIFIAQNEGNLKDFEIERLKNDKAVNYYNYYIEVSQKQSLKERIGYTVSYFEKKAASSDSQLYIGRSYGEETRYTHQYQHNEYLAPVYIDLKPRTTVALVNLAIVKLKIEDDFVSFKLNKLIVFLHDFKLISDDYYCECIYGTTDRELINLVRFGLNVSIVKKLSADAQINNLFLDVNGNLKASEPFYDYLKNQPELFKYEIDKYLV